MRLEGKVVLITGGESGIGLATARLLKSEGAQLHIVGLQEEPLAVVAEELDALTSVADVTDEAAVERAVAAASSASAATTSSSPTPATVARSPTPSTTPRTSSSACWTST